MLRNIESKAAKYSLRILNIKKMKMENYFLNSPV
jgi:hypothetical protein